MIAIFVLIVIAIPPKPQTSDKTISLTAWQRISNFKIEQINPTNVIGLLYILYPVEYVNGTQTTLNIGDTVGYACDGSLAKLIAISNNTARFITNITAKSHYGCPI